MSAALTFSQVSKRFILQHERPQSLQERFVRLFRPRQTAEEFWALRDVTFEVQDGETFGILGRNGAGKSTLLKLATGILKPTSGQVRKHRRTYAMLELGAGFHPELSGRDNIFLNGSIYGLSRAQMRATFDQIVAFAELEQFIDTPVKHYSSGMFMRLGFATAIHMQPELLVIDEILAVGDAAFRRKCTEALWGLKRRGVTILFVSHNEEAVYQFCDRALLLSHGQVAALGATDDVVTAYARLLETAGDAAGHANGRRLTIHAAAVVNERGLETLTLAPGEPWAVELVVAVPPGPATLQGEAVLQTDTGSQLVVAPLALALAGDGGVRHLRATFAPAPLHAGRLRLAARLTWTGADGTVAMDEYESPESVTVGDHGHGPLLHLPHQWTDLTAGPPAAVTGAATEPANPVEHAALGYFAEGYTGSGFATLISLVNPAPAPVQVALRLDYGADGAGAPAWTGTLGPRATSVVDLAAIAGRGKEVAVALAADRPVVAARTVRFSAFPAIGGLAYNRPRLSGLRGLRGGFDALPAAAPSAAWYFAEGYTGAGFEVYFAIQNPGPAATTVTIEYFPDGGDVVSRRLDLPGRQRRTVAVHAAGDPGGLGPDRIFSARLTAPPDRPVVAERVTYFRYQGAGFAATGAAAGPGATAPATAWYFADGSTRAGFDQYLTLYNPGDAPSEVTITYLVEDRHAPVERHLTLAPRRRATVLVHEPPSPANPAGLGRELTSALVIGATAPIVAERPAYFAFDGGAALGPVAGGHHLLGATAPVRAGQSIVFAPPAAPDELVVEHLAVLNLDDVPARLMLTGLRPDGAAAAEAVMAPPRARLTVPLCRSGDSAQPTAARSSQPALSVTVTAAGPQGVVVERARFFRRADGVSGGAASFGTLVSEAPPALLELSGGSAGHRDRPDR
jgi:ABC-type polysaccharide/polyol phosphate transport system ATPase subunit